MKQFGGGIKSEHKERYSKSPNWRDGKFQNLVETSLNITWQNIPKLIYKQLMESRGREPKRKLPVIPFNKHEFLAPSDEAKIIWYGHSVILLRINGKTILIDPMLGPNAAPIAPVSVQRFSENTLDLIDNFPTIDLLLLTHDHYDHLDLASIKKIQSKVDQYYVALGTARHLTKWGVDGNKIREFDWWEKADFQGIEIHYTPTRHFSGRGLQDRMKSLWGGWVIFTGTEKIYFSGDSGYGDHFKEVGKRLGPFDIGLMECGQYNEHWQDIHMFPEESVQAAIDAGVKQAMPVHWAGFALSQHKWKEPVDRFISEAGKQQLNIFTPELGALFNTSQLPISEWWNKFE